jgi:hypothetical protein
VGAMGLVSLLIAVLASCAHGDRVPADLTIRDNQDVDEDGTRADHCARAGTTSTDGSCPETGLPKRVGAPLHCPVPETAPAGQPLCLQCRVKAGVKADAALLHYRRPGGPWSFRSRPMRRTPRGWFRGIVPADVMSGSTIELCFEALDGIDRVATYGARDSPHSIS